MGFTSKLSNLLERKKRSSFRGSVRLPGLPMCSHCSVDKQINGVDFVGGGHVVAVRG